MRSRELRQQYAATVARAQEINAKAVLTPEESQQFDAIMAEADGLSKRVTDAERLEQIDMGLRADRTAVASATGVSVDEQTNTVEREKRIFKAWLLRNEGGLSPEDRQVVQNRIQAAAATGPATAGGYTIPPLFMRELIIAQKAFGGMRLVAREISTDGGQMLPWPTMDDTNNVATIVGENTPGVAGPDLQFGTIAMTAFMYRSGFLTVSYELMQDSAFDFDALIRDALAIRFARGQNRHFTNGDGVTQPQGVTLAAGTGKTGAAGQTTSVIYDDLVDLEHSLDPAYRQNSKYMMADSSVRAIRKLKDAYGRPLFWNDTDALAAGSGTYQYLNGVPIVINQDMPVMAPNAKSILYGDFSTYLIRDVMGVTIKRLDELFSINGQVGFIGFQRTDGRVIAAPTTTTITSYRNSAT